MGRALRDVLAMVGIVARDAPAAPRRRRICGQSGPQEVGTARRPDFLREATAP
jgi:hypothetical protein